MRYAFLSFLLAWIFPERGDRNRFRNLCNSIDDREYSKTLYSKTYPNKLKKISLAAKKRKIKILFLNSEISKWQYQMLYEKFDSHSGFDVQLAIYPNEDSLKKMSQDELKNSIEANYNYFCNKNMSVSYAYDFEKEKFIDLKTFKPDIVFYEQPWALPKKYSVLNVSKFALTMYCSYGSQITNGSNEYSTNLHKEIYKEFIDNEYIKQILIDHDVNNEVPVFAGQLKLDMYLKPLNDSNICWKTNGKKRIIWAPHFSFYRNSILGFGTFDWNYKFFYEYAKQHQEYEFIFKPHTRLKYTIIEQNLMSEEEVDKYFKDWDALPNAQVITGCNYIDMFKASDLMITDCNSFLYEYLPTNKPLIHMIGRYTVGHNEFGQKLCRGYYAVEDIEGLSEILNELLVNENDYLKNVREEVIKNDLVQPEGGTAQFILDYIIKLLKGEEQ